MSYLNKVVGPDETVIHVAKVHWVVYLRGLTVIALGIGLGAAVNEYFYALCALGLLMLIPGWFYSFTTELAVTDRKAVAKWGLLRRQTIEQRLSTIDSVRVNQSILGRLLNYGTIEVTGSGFSITPMRDIADPLAIRRAVEKAEFDFKNNDI
ncbi:MAG: PH domain-containing protein [Pseudomonadota bacterium]